MTLLITTCLLAPLPFACGFRLSRSRPTRLML